MKKILLYLSVGLCFLFLFSYFRSFPVPKGALYYLKNFAAAAVIILIYLAAGIKMAGFFSREKNGETKYPYAFGLATVLFGTLLFAAGFLKLYNVFFAVVLLALLALACAPEIKEILLDVQKTCLALAARKYDLKETAFITLFALVSGYLFICSMAPPLYYDTLVYHLGVPARYIAEKGIVNMPENIFSFFPQLGSMNYILFLLVGDELAVKIYQFFFGVMSASLIFSFAKEIKANGYIALLLLACCPLFSLNTGRVTSELPQAFFALLMLHVIFHGHDRQIGPGDAALAGVFAGGAMAVKYTGIVVYMFLLIYIVYLIVKKRAGLKTAAIALVIPALVVLPYLLRNYFFTGDPVYPFLTGAFKTTGILKDAATSYISHVAGFGYEKNLLNFMLVPVYMTFNLMAFGGDAISPLILVAIVLSGLAANKKTLGLILFSIFYYTAWFYTGQVLRFILPLIMVAALLGGVIYDRLRGWLAYALFGALLLIQLSSSVYYNERYIEPFKLFSIGRGNYISERITYYDSCRFLGEYLRNRGKVFFVGEARSFYCTLPAFTYTVFNRRALFDDFDKIKETDFLKRLEERGIGIIVINKDESERLKAGGFSDVYDIINTGKFKKIMDRHFERIYVDKNCEVYLLADEEELILKV